ncbi:MAG: hypothetical protein RIQ60_1781 [Pseudomonadota bacterium]|jgi:hypothetical protein
MEFGALLLLALAIATLTIRSSIKNARLPATEADWFVVFDIDAEKKVLGLWFYPVVALEQRENQTIAITSRPGYTTKLAATRPAKQSSQGMWGVSVSYGRWLRDGAPFDEAGNPDLQDSSDFSATVESYLLGEYKLHFATPVPVFYQAEIQKAIGRVKREASQETPSK